MSGFLSSGTERTDAETLFLVELIAPGLRTGGALRMADAVQRAAARLTPAGTHLAWRGGLFVPAQSRCLSLVHADSEAVVRHVCDVAGLATATVHRATLLPPPRAPAAPAPAPPQHLGEDAGAAHRARRPE